MLQNSCHVFVSIEYSKTDKWAIKTITDIWAIKIISMMVDPRMLNWLALVETIINYPVYGDTRHQ